MATNLSSSTVSAGTDATAAQYNNLRSDVVVNAGDYEDSAGSSGAYTLSIDASISAYAAGQVFKFKANHATTGAATLNVNSIGAKTILKNGDQSLIANDIKSGDIVVVVYDGTNMQMTSTVKPPLKFGGDGSDGALTITSGTTTLDISSANVYIKQYTSISITGTGDLAFSNSANNGSIVILKTQGDVTGTSSADPNIDVSGLGASCATFTPRTAYYLFDADDHHGTNGGDGSAGTGGAIIDSYLRFYTTSTMSPVASHRHQIAIVCGASGGTGGLASGSDAGGGGGGGSLYSAGANGGLTANGGNAGGNSAGGGGASSENSGGTVGSNNALGGSGGGALLIECGGDLNFTGNIDALGNDGENGDGQRRSGGGGGAGGMVCLLYNSLTAASGTIDTSGGAGGDATATYTGGTGGGSASGEVLANYDFA